MRFPAGEVGEDPRLIASLPVDGGGFGSVQPGHLSVATSFEEEAQRQAWVRLLRLHDSRSRTCSDAAELELLHVALQNTEAFSLLRHTQGEVWLL